MTSLRVVSNETRDSSKGARHGEGVPVCAHACDCPRGVFSARPSPPPPPFVCTESCCSQTSLIKLLARYILISGKTHVFQPHLQFLQGYLSMRSNVLAHKEISRLKFSYDPDHSTERCLAVITQGCFPITDHNL